MNKERFIYTLIIILALFTTISCEERVEDTVLFDEIPGTISFDLDRYIHKDIDLDLTASGAQSTAEIKWKWVLSSIIKDTISGQNIKIHVPDTLYSFNVVAIASAKGCFNNTKTITTTTVDTTRFTGSLQGVDHNGHKVFIDKRDNRGYYYTQIGQLDWFTENLAYHAVGAPIENSMAVSPLYGCLYTWEEATGGVSASGLASGPQGACPEGWSVPTNEDWEDFGKVLNDGADISFADTWNKLGEKVTFDAYFNGARLWPYSPNNNHFHTIKWNALPCGYSIQQHKSFILLGKYGFWWSSTEQNSSQANYRYIYCEEDAFPSNYTDKRSIGYSVRCVRLAQ